ncbi:MAG: hypothetical protein NC217_02680 [Muribaculaceae bacterium]|nr:hypothetical protein [Muribaculaceae bacterium]
MKKTLLFGAFAAVALSASAKADVHWINMAAPDPDYNMAGLVTCVSPNGEYAVVCDDEMFWSYLWRKSDPDKLEYLNWPMQEGSDNKVWLEVYGVNNDGTVVGAYKPLGNQYHPFYKELDGDVVDLPLPSWVQNSNYAIGISDNGKIIGGYVKGANSDKTKPGEVYSAYWPIIWEKGADGEFTVQYYSMTNKPDDSEMASHQGMYVNSMYSDGTLEGTWLGGQLYCGAGSHISAIWNRGHVVKFNELGVIEVPFYVQGKPYGVYRYETIDGKRDLCVSDNDVVDAAFTCCDYEGNFFGTRFHVGTFRNLDDNTDEDTYHISKGDTYTWGSYNVNTREWTEEDGRADVSCALSKDVFFVGHNLFTDGIGSTPINYADEYEIDTKGTNWGGVSAASADGQVLGLNFTTTDGTGKVTVHPFIAVLDRDVNGLQNIVANTDNQHVIMVYGDTIEVAGAEQVAVYDLNGAQVGNGNITNVNAGIYVVVADGQSYKILVK